MGAARSPGRLLLALAAILWLPSGVAQTSAPAPPAPLATRDSPERTPLSEKQKAIEADTEKLVQMAAELKVSVDKSNKNELSLDVVRKAEAVEKLARSLKERIRASDKPAS